MQKSCRNVFLGHLGDRVFHIFPKVALDHGVCPQMSFRIFVYHFITLNSSPMQHVQDGALCAKNR